MSRKRTDGKEAFEAFYSSIYKDRWPALRQALTDEKSPVPYSRNLLKEYFLDEASITAASLLPLKEDDRVLDMCAAPGGKTLVLASRMNGNVTIVANDRSRDRKARLDKVLTQHLEASVLERIFTTCRDASRWGLYEKDAYDAVLLDAPCSSERHVIMSEEHLSIWSPNRPKRLAIEQYSLLASAFMAVKEKGYILYSTCSINPKEDEEVVARLFRKKEGLVEEIPLCVENAESRKYGKIIMPDTADGSGPMYFALLRKLRNEPCRDNQM